jgi:hypothetical protein
MAEGWSFASETGIESSTRVTASLSLEAPFRADPNGLVDVCVYDNVHAWSYA